MRRCNAAEGRTPHRMKIQLLSVDQAYASLRSSARGLADDEAQRRLAEYGPNRVEERRGDPQWKRLVREFTHLFARILWVGAALAFVGEWHDPGQGMATLGWAIVGVIVLNGVFSFWQEYRAERAVTALRSLLPRRVRVLRAARTVEVAAEALVPGDLVLLAGGDRVPADCRVVQSYALRVDTATVTGESRAAARSADPCVEDDPLHARNLLLAGTALVSGEATALVFATGMHTEFGRIASLSQAAREPLSPLQREIARLSRLVALLAIAMGATCFLVGQWVGLPFWLNFVFAIGIIVANVPEGLLPTVTLSLAMATQRMARRNALVRHLPAVETLGAATVICTDKTGTLTLDRMTVARLWLAGGFVDARDLTAEAPPARRLLETARHCHTVTLVDDHGALRHRGDPMEVALVALADRLLPGTAAPRVDEVPFDADRRRMSTVHERDGRRTVYCKGALETVLPLCTHVEQADGTVPLGPIRRQAFIDAQETLAADGLRVLAFAHRELDAGSAKGPFESALVLSGLVGLEDPPRPEVPAAVAQCRAAGIRVIMVTGDHPHTARAIAQRVGLDGGPDAPVVTGDVLRRMSDTQLQLALDTPGILFARVAADQKMRIVDALKRKGEIVAATGDGVNDAPALKSAHIGIAMGLSGTDVARESADMILLDDNFASIVAAVEEGRAVYENLRRFLTYILTSNIPELVPYLAFVLFRIPLPLTILQILAVDLGTDILPALALGAEKPDPEGMRRPPRRRDEPLLHGGLLARAYLFLGPLEAAAAMAAYFFVLAGGGWQYGDTLAPNDPLYLQATTACLAAIVAMQVINVFLCRHPRSSLLTTGLGGNRLIAAGVALEIALIAAIVYTPSGQWLFATAPLGWEVWALLVPLGLAMLLLEEGRKAVARSLDRQ